ncbi:alanine racemase protein [Haloplasma contractile SSD-17B]|uniref:Alanine racemase protein n=2 Tax=Haloplasma TaxID=471824 RepID=U2FRN3_9MOLU|nr:alanine racemase protein [Haloplasma contractile SSD-17B]
MNTMVTIHDISKETGYSITTVSKALNGYKDISDKAKNLILEKAKEMGYLPNASARSLVMKKTWTIGVVFEEQTGVGITHPFFGDVLNKFKKHVEAKGYDILFISESIGRNIKSYLDHCRQKGVDGIIILCTYDQNENIQELIDSPIPSVLIDFNVEQTNCVYTNNFKSLYEAVEYLYEKGHRKIAHIYGDQFSYAGAERLRGYKQALIDLNIPLSDDYLFEGTNYSLAEGYQRGLDIIALEDKPTAIIAASDNLAIGTMKAFEEYNIKVPDDISIIGFDNIEISALIDPPLTTINQDKEQIAAEAADSLVLQIEDKKKQYQKTVIDGILIERETVKKLN